MKHDGLDDARRAARWAGITLSEAGERLLERYAAWLLDEALAAGGLGPREGERLWSRHIGDSLSFAAGLTDLPDGTVADVGTGVGLPGIPLAIALPHRSFELIERAGRRTRLLHRALRILDIPNVTVTLRDVFRLDARFAGIVSRGAIPQRQFVAQASRLLVPHGVAVVGLSRTTSRPEGFSDLTRLAADLGLLTEVIEVPRGVLDAPSWLLKLRFRGEH